MRAQLVVAFDTLHGDIYANKKSSADRLLALAAGRVDAYSHSTAAIASKLSPGLVMQDPDERDPQHRTPRLPVPLEP